MITLTSSSPADQITVAAPGTVTGNGTSAPSVTLNEGETEFSWTITPADSGERTVTFTNDEGMPNPAPVTYEALILYTFRVRAMDADEKPGRARTVTGGRRRVLDPDALDWAATADSVGGTYTSSDVSALSAFIAGCKADDAWDYLTEVCPFAGTGKASHSIKLKGEGLLVMSAGITDADCTRAGGIDSGVGNTDKYVSGFPAPTDVGLSSTDFSFGFYNLGRYGDSFGRIFAESPDSGEPRWHLDTGFASGLMAVCSDASPRSPHFGMCSYSESGGYVTRSRTITIKSLSTSAVTLDKTPELFRTKRHGDLWLCDAAVGFLFIGRAMPEAIAKMLGARVDRLMAALGRQSSLPACLMLGDSITKGGSATHGALQWSYLVSDALGLRDVNMGVGSSRLNDPFGVVRSGMQMYQDATVGTPAKVFVLYGMNDMNGDIENGDDAVVATFQSNLEAVATYLLARGVSTNDVVIGSVPYTTASNSTKQAKYVGAALAAAQAAGVMYADVNAAMKAASATDPQLEDGIHPNNAGHATIAAALLSATPA